MPLLHHQLSAPPAYTPRPSKDNPRVIEARRQRQPTLPEERWSPVSPTGPAPTSPSNEPPPPLYADSVKPMYLTLDGGGSKVYIEALIVDDLLHRLAWDLHFIQPRGNPRENYQIPPKDCFDCIGAKGCGTIIAYMFACGMTASKTAKEFQDLSPLLSASDFDGVRLRLGLLIPLVEKADGSIADDAPSQACLYLPKSKSEQTEDSEDANLDATMDDGKEGIKLEIGTPLKECILPLVMEEVIKERKGEATSLNCTPEFLREVCPSIDDCTFLLSIGSGEVLEQQKQLSWSDWLWGVQLPTFLPSWKLTDAQREEINKHVPPWEFQKRYVRLNPNLITIESVRTKKMVCPPDWEAINFAPHRFGTSSFFLLAKTKILANHVVDLLKRKTIPGPHPPPAQSAEPQSIDALLSPQSPHPHSHEYLLSLGLSR